ncbi:MAG: trigger factor [Symbiobacteriaceae bacterium]|nr:trigger factor [Symbiobacteriaceae bacterium]
MQLVSQEKLEKSIVRVRVEVPQEQVEEAIMKAYRKIGQRVTLPGFRKGKATKKMIERRYGVEIFYEDALEFLSRDVVTWLLDELEPELIDQPGIDVESFSHDAPVTFILEYPVFPEIVLGEYRGVRAVKQIREVDEAAITSRLTQLQQQHARQISVLEGQAIMGDTVTLDYTGYIDDEPFEGGAGLDYQLELGSGRFIPGFEEQLVGQNVGEDLEVQVFFPEDYRVEELAGSPALFKCKMKEIRRKELLPIDDEFAQDISEYSTLEEWRLHLQEELAKEYQEQGEESFRMAILNQIAQNATIDIPEVMIDREVESRLRQFVSRLSMQGISLEDFLQATQQDISQMATSFRPQAQMAVKQNLVLREIAKQEGLEASPDDVRSYLHSGDEPFSEAEENALAEIFADEGALRYYQNEATNQKVIDLLAELAIPIDASEAVHDMVEAIIAQDAEGALQEPTEEMAAEDPEEEAVPSSEPKAEPPEL